MTTFAWSDKNMACIATYNILEADGLLNQFDRVFLPFSKAGETALSSLPYFPKFGGAAADIEGRSAQMARKFFKLLLVLYTNRTEHPNDTIEKMLATFAALFASKKATFSDLAEAADNILKFKGEPGGPA